MYAKGIITLLSLVLSSVNALEYCYSDVVGVCSPAGGELQNCNAKYGHFSGVMRDLQSYTNAHITRNFQFLLMSTHFSNHEAQRPGLASLYRKYADKYWEDAIDLIKYMTKRGGNMDFAYKKQNVAATDIENYEMSEIHSLSKALDIWKNVAEEAHLIHGEAARRQANYHDPEWLRGLSIWDGWIGKRSGKRQLAAVARDTPRGRELGKRKDFPNF